MNTFRFVPEGWNEEIEKLNLQKIREYKEENRIVQGIVESCDEQYNLHIQLGNEIEGIIPRSEVEDMQEGLPDERLCTGKVHKYVQFKIENIENDNTVVLSRKSVQQEASQYIKNIMQVGEQVTGIVKNIRPYGAFIEIGGGVVGLAHIEDLSVARIKTPYERLKIGQKVKVVVKSIDRYTGKVNLSYKETLGTWEENAEKFSTGMKVEGIMRETEKNKNGIFIELTPNLVGMAEYREGYEYGQKVNVYIKTIDKQKRKVKLLIEQ